jgi:hypothetical protein
MPSAAAGKRPCARSDTQEFLAEMLGVRRTSVSVVAHTLQQAGMIKYRWGTIEILDVDGLEESACECYGTAFSTTVLYWASPQIKLSPREPCVRMIVGPYKACLAW